VLSGKHFSGHVGQAGVKEFLGFSFIKGMLSVTGRLQEQLADQGPLQDHQGFRLEGPWLQWRLCFPDQLSLVPLNQAFVVLRIATRFRFLKATAKIIGELTNSRKKKKEMEKSKKSGSVFFGYKAGTNMT
jgi:hypothetical protein